MPVQAKVKLIIIRFLIFFLNWTLRSLEVLLFRKKAAPKKILIFKVGNIGDVACAVPVMVAVRKYYKDSRITLLTSPGTKGVPGASELLSGASFVDEIKVYDSTDIDSFRKIKNLIASLRREKYDAFIHIPAHDRTKWRTMVRNMIFAKLIGTRSACGFRIRTIYGLFTKTQIDWGNSEKEAGSLIKIFKESGIGRGEIEFDFPVPESSERRAEEILKNKWPDYPAGFYVAFHAGSKQKEKEWLYERFGEIAGFFADEYKARLIIVGGADDKEGAEIIKLSVDEKSVLATAGELKLQESVALIKRISFVVAIDGGIMHIAAGLGKPVVALFSVMSIFGKWFPYGDNLEIIAHKFLNCDYRTKEGIAESMRAIQVDEVKSACRRLIGRI